MSYVKNVDNQAEIFRRTIMDIGFLKFQDVCSQAA